MTTLLWVIDIDPDMHRWPKKVFLTWVENVFGELEAEELCNCCRVAAEVPIIRDFPPSMRPPGGGGVLEIFLTGCAARGLKP